MREYPDGYEHRGKQKAHRGYDALNAFVLAGRVLRLFSLRGALFFAGIIGFFLCSGLSHYSAYLPLSEYEREDYRQHTDYPAVVGKSAEARPAGYHAQKSDGQNAGDHGGDHTEQIRRNK